MKTHATSRSIGPSLTALGSALVLALVLWAGPATAVCTQQPPADPQTLPDNIRKNTNVDQNGQSAGQGDDSGGAIVTTPQGRVLYKSKSSGKE